MSWSWHRLLSRARPILDPPVLQIAADGRWETAAVLVLSGPAVTARAVLHQIAATAEHDVALEVLWPGAVFIGVRWPAEALSQADAALERVLAITGGDPAVILAAALGAGLGESLTCIVVGAVNAWLSTGAEVIWRPGRTADPDSLLGMVDQRPDLLMCRHRVAVEFVADHPWPHWAGVEISTPEGDRHRLDRAALADLLTIVP